MQKKLVAEFANDSYVKMNGSLKLGKDVSRKKLNFSSIARKRLIERLQRSRRGRASDETQAAARG